MLLVLFLIIALLLHWPYRWVRTWDFLGREVGEMRALMYHYTYGPRHDRLDYNGLSQLQVWLLQIITTVAARLQPELIAWLVELFRHLLP
ncbi:hypothetical protein EYB53_023135 [Candidatus Chloroploca sp. M-50]|uniref:Uncharacterized protein n=1 Tax=Candidatus Chloroploca mongolica TaxID=2528176 RepID=A0ABS4DGR4_9CHLR|nr:hypothetical protein [Candidatus Chloroploca mongolica]MBP1468627.1 hypothetical protein [Candidatus Chloroploca mongolica]